MQTTYSVDILPESHPVFKPEMIPADFNAFNNFNIAKHSYWEKTEEEINVYLTTGQFPERAPVTTQQMTNTVSAVASAVPVGAPQTFSQTAPSFTPVAPNVGQVTTNIPATNVTPTPAPYTTTTATNVEPPVRNFTGFSF